ncbi:MAG: hypothetical protein A3J62_00360 [Candidatus Buchananbacteria bacterium RIFCSPHIGHO2_02_FULL_38_8]|uniref:Uncharacterized protein n=2 Tax=Candidatus Buchananiibacteriota TaxID=1817903 RepID=A0A1G1XUQ2_9BACT|nr:MAG: hypothetical protein A2731_02215 [Candidatus Buchananbacteria bacterium RIFCSPHIGHO2_01_FULL_39_8]OGY47983.1 MAG: hypothetical protein A3J62_00360 [Candidatus Buchananbacteria bacterium RIFCSPHIGHO2_02_FULL_38_8]
MTNKIKLGVFLLVIFSLSVFILVSAQEAPPPPPKVCGDGNIDEPNDLGVTEQCDDGNQVDGDGCNYSSGSGCRFVCGDGAVQSPNGDDQYEKCDTVGNGYCTNDPNKECTEDKDCPGSKERCIFSCTSECGVKLLGWAWSDNFGWLSLNRDNCDHLSPEVLPPGSGYDVTEVCLDHFDPDIDYYVQILPDQNSNLTGRAWSPEKNIGWVCFGDYCNAFSGGDFGSVDPPDSQNRSWARVADFNVANSDISGWAKILLNGDEGWVSLNCDDMGGCGTSDYKLQLGSEFYSVHGDDNNKVLRKVLFGWAWNGSDSIGGLGWINFTPVVSGLKPWLETRAGDIYARGGIRASRPIGAFNATYRILAFGGIKALSAQGELWLDEKYGPIDFPTPQTRYSNILGKLDVNGLFCSAPCTNKYGNKVLGLSSLEEVITNSESLGGNIYYHDGEVVIGEGGNLLASGGNMIFRNGSNFEKGSGTIIVNGDLTIKTNIEYDPNDALTKFINLASVAWIVRGDLKISPNVQKLAGNFIVLGKPDVSLCDQDPLIETPGCGQVYSCYGGSAGTCDDYRLEVSGLMMARKFFFKRTYTDPGEEVQLGSELIIYDGRLLAHIPPGLDDFVSALPIWRSGVFSQ